MNPSHVFESYPFNEKTVLPARKTSEKYPVQVLQKRCEASDKHDPTIVKTCS